MRIAVISDIHSNLDAFEAVIASLPSYDHLLCLGDIVGYGAEPDGVIRRLHVLQPKIVLMGNHDFAVASLNVSDFSQPAARAVEWTRRRISDESLRYLSSLAESAKIEVAGKRLALFHGSPAAPLSEYVFPEISEHDAEHLMKRAGAEIVLLGHTHIPMTHFVRNSLLANPGSVGQPRDGDPRASYAVLSISANVINFEIMRAEYDIDSAADKIRKAGLPSFLADRLYEGM